MIRRPISPSTTAGFNALISSMAVASTVIPAGNGSALNQVFSSFHKCNRNSRGFLRNATTQEGLDDSVSFLKDYYTTFTEATLIVFPDFVTEVRLKDISARKCGLEETIPVQASFPNMERWFQPPVIQPGPADGEHSTVEFTERIYLINGNMAQEVS